MEDVQFLITTYNRQESCQRLVDALQGQGSILVLNDGCDYDITGCRQIKQRIHYGRGLYGKTVHNLFRMRSQHRYYIMLPDDCIPSDDIAKKAVRLWEDIKDEKKICLNLYADRIGMECWTNFKPQDAGHVWRTGWVDMCFLCKENFFGLLPALSNIKPVKHRSSGVGMYISRRLHRRGYHFYQTKESLVELCEEHGVSQMKDSNNITQRIPHNKKPIFITDTRNLKKRW